MKNAMTSHYTVAYRVSVGVVATICVLLHSCVFAQNTDTSLAPITVTYCVDPQWMPYEGIKTGQHVGLSADYMAIIAEYAAVEFKLVPTVSWEQTLDFLRRGQCQVGSMLNSSAERREYLTFTKVYFNSENVFVTNDDQAFVSGYASLRGKTLGIVEGYRHMEYVKRYYPNLEIKPQNSEADALLSLAAGDVDVIVGSLLSVSSHIQKFGLNDLRISGVARPNDELAMGVTIANTDLVNRLNNAIEQITEEQHIALFDRWNQFQKVNRVDYRWTVALVVIFVIALLLVGARNRYMTHFNRMLVNKNTMLEELQRELLDKNAQLERLSRRDKLTNLFNRHHMIERCEQEMAFCGRHDLACCLVVFDIDFFKRINDSFGHNQGDKVLKIISQIVMKNIREIDVLSRWGGEEFLLLFPHTNLLEVEALVERIRVAISEHGFDPMPSITCSFGVAQYSVEESFTQWFNRADQAMYRAKEQGRNRTILANE